MLRSFRVNGIIARPKRGTVTTSKTPPTVVHTPDTAVASYRILVKFPTRARPEKFMRCLERWTSFLSGAHDTRFVVTVDEDDAATLELRSQIEAIDFVELEMMKSTGKIAAINYGLANRSFDILIVASDDMWPQVQGYDALIAEDMARQFPSLDGALHYHDGYRGDICTLPIMGRGLYERWGYVYHPDYRSLWCDNEYTDVARALGKYWYSRQRIVKHEHAVNTGEQADALLRFNNAYFNIDKKTYLERRARKFDMVSDVLAPLEPDPNQPESPKYKPVLSLLIPTVPERQELLDRLLAELRRQIDIENEPETVEIHVLSDDGTMSVGAKRNALLEAVNGHYSAFIDDDDEVAPTYVRSILEAIAENPGVDCVTFDGEMTTNGENPRMFRFSLDLDDRTVSWGYERRPNHLCAIRAELAKQVKFPGTSFGEDANWSGRLRHLLKTQARINHTLYYYRFSTTGTLTHHRTAKPKELTEPPETVPVPAPAPKPKIASSRSGIVKRVPGRNVIKIRRR